MRKFFYCPLINIEIYNLYRVYRIIHPEYLFSRIRRDRI